MKRSGGPRLPVAGCGEDSTAEQQILPCRQGRLSIPVRREDLFFATAWWTAYCAQRITAWQAEHYQNALQAILYLIQDYEPGFYPWSSEYLLAESTYKYAGAANCSFNTKRLKRFLTGKAIVLRMNFISSPINNKLLEYKRA